MLNKLMNTIVVAFLSLSACGDEPVITEDADGGADDGSPADVQEEVETFTPLCSDPFSCTPERECDRVPVQLVYSDLDVPFMIEGSFSSPPATYGVEDDAFLTVSWLDSRVEWNHIPQGNHSFSIEYSCFDSTWWTVTATLDDIQTVSTFSGTCENQIDFTPAITAAPDCEFGPICTVAAAE
jgi:hypothetical protein